MAGQATSREPGPDGGAEGEIARLREELARSREEILRLRDLLIGKDAELGTARGRLAELEAQAGRLATAGARVRARLSRAVRMLGSGRTSRS